MSTKNPFDQYGSLGSVKSEFSESDEYEVERLTDEPRDVLAETDEPRSLGSLMAIVVVMVFVLSLRLFYLDVIKGSQNKVLAEGNTIRSREILPARGQIVDRNGASLANDVTTYSLEIFPAELPRKLADRNRVLDQVHATTDVDMQPVKEQLAAQGLYGLNPIIAAEQVDRETAIIWQAKLADAPGIEVAKLPQRSYAETPGIGHVVGYVGKVSAADLKNSPDLSTAAMVGKTGLESEYETNLQGKSGEERVEVDAAGRVQRVLSELPALAGDTLKLTIDAGLETSLTNHLVEFSNRQQSAQAAAVVMDVNTGGILAMTSLPSFDPNVFIDQSQRATRNALLTDSHDPLLNRVISGTYPSGSAVKPIIGTAALEAGVITPNTKIDTSAGVLQVGGSRFPDWKTHGLSDVRQAIAESNDIFFYEVGGGYQSQTGLGADRLHDWLAKFGFGQATGVDLPGEVSGLDPSPAWKLSKIKEKWFVGDSYHLAIGQGYFLTTPLQLVTAISAVANGGTLYQPYLVAQEQHADGTVLSETKPKPTAEHIADPANLAVIREGMRQTVLAGTSRSLNTLSIPVAGKTGTAQFGKGNSSDHSWYVGYAPADHPQIAWAILVEGGGEATDAAVPVAKAFLQDWIDQTHPTP